MEIQFEICAGIGCGLSFLLLISWLAARFRRWKRAGAGPPATTQWHIALVRWAALISLLAYMLKVDVSGPARLITPYYVLLMPLLLTGSAHEWLVRARWWQGLAGAALLLCAGLLVINPPRPLWPARTILARLEASQPQSQVITRARKLYTAYAGRWDALAPVRDQIPPRAKNVGFITFMAGSTMETSLWRPFGQRRIWPLPRSAARPELERKGIEYVVVGTDASIRDRFGEFQQWLDQWCRTNSGTVTAQARIPIRATEDPAPWFLIHLAPAFQ